MDISSIESHIEDLAEMMDASAEADNSHNFVGVHRALAYIAYRVLGSEATLKLFLEIANETADLGRGPESESPFCGLFQVPYRKEDGAISLNTFSLPRTWRDWSLSAPNFDPEQQA